MADSKHSDHVLRTVHSGSAAAQSSLAASWCRSALHHGLDPAMERRGDRIEAARLSSLREANGELLAAAVPVLDNLFGSVGRTGCCVILSDLDGVVLEARSGAGGRPRTCCGTTSRAFWSEITCSPAASS